MAGSWVHGGRAQNRIELKNMPVTKYRPGPMEVASTAATLMRGERWPVDTTAVQGPRSPQLPTAATQAKSGCSRRPKATVQASSPCSCSRHFMATSKQTSSCTITTESYHPAAPWWLEEAQAGDGLELHPWRAIPRQRCMPNIPIALQQPHVLHAASTARAPLSSRQLPDSCSLPE